MVGEVGAGAGLPQRRGLYAEAAGSVEWGKSGDGFTPFYQRPSLYLSLSCLSLSKNKKNKDFEVEISLVFFISNFLLMMSSAVSVTANLTPRSPTAVTPKSNR